MSARLHVLLGEGGVGKTTLAAAYALALASRGRKVALLGVDPARRLQTALGLALGDGAAKIALPGMGGGELHAALLVPEATLRRWATEGLRDERERARLLGNRFFAALADRLATTTDVIAAVRIAEWAEQAPELTDFVVDTAPGRNGLELLTRPSALVGLARGRALGWLRHAGAHGGAPGVGRRVLRGLSHLGGSQMLVELAELASSVEQPFRRVLDRLERAEAWVHDPATELLLVTAVREDAAAQTRALATALAAAELAPSAVLLNRTLPRALGAELGRVDLGTLGEEARAIVRYARAYVELEERVARDAVSLAPKLVRVPATSGLDRQTRIERLAALGACLDDGLTPAA